MPGLCREHAHAAAPEGGTVSGCGKRDYCLFIRGLSFGEFSGCAYLRNDGNPLAIFYTLPPSAARLHAARGNATETRSGGGLFMAARLRCDEDRLRAKEEKKKRRGRRKSERDSYRRFFMHSAGLICAEGDLWRDQRRFVAGCLKNFGMTKLPGARRDRMEERILAAVNECTSVN